MADTFTVRVRGLEQLQNKIAKLQALEKVVIEPTLDKWRKETRGKLKAEKYPKKLPNQVYVRTGILASSWSSKRLGRATVGLFNRAKQKGRYYPQYVIGLLQAKIHQGRWWLALDVVKEKHIPPLLKELKRKIDNIIHGQRYF